LCQTSECGDVTVSAHHASQLRSQPIVGDTEGLRTVEMRPGCLAITSLE
jgi:hypothetical protein